MIAFLEQLIKEHQHGLAQLAMLDDAAARLSHNGYNSEDMQTIQRAVIFINNDIRSHNEREEEYLFPEIEKIISPMGPTAVMKSEHRLLWDGLNQVEASLPSIQEQSAKEELDMLYRAILSVVQLLRNHIAKEEQILFPMAERSLQPDQKAHLDAIHAGLMKKKI